MKKVRIFRAWFSHSMLEHAYSVAKDAFIEHEDGTLEAEEASLNVMDIFPPHWPFAKMTLPWTGLLLAI